MAEIERALHVKLKYGYMLLRQTTGARQAQKLTPQQAAKEAVQAAMENRIK